MVAHRGTHFSTNKHTTELKVSREEYGQKEITGA